MSEFSRKRTKNGLDGLKPAFERLADGVSTLVKQHIELARYEATRDIRTATRRMAILGACALIGGVGYLFLLATGVLLAGWLGGWLAAWICAAVIASAHLGVGGVMGRKYSKKLRAEKPVDLAQLGDELNKDKQWLQQIAATSKKPEPPAALSPKPMPPN